MLPGPSLSPTTKPSHLLYLCLSSSAPGSYFNLMPLLPGKSNLYDMDSSPYGQEAFIEWQTSLSHFQVGNCVLTALMALLSTPQAL